METYLDYAAVMRRRIGLLLNDAGMDHLPESYAEYLRLDQSLRKMISNALPLVLSDNYEHFMAQLPGKRFGAQQVLIRRQIGDYTVASGFWKWLEFLCHQITHEEVELVADFFSGRHNRQQRPFDKNYWHDRVVDQCNGYLPIRVEFPGEGAVFTGVPFPVAQVYGDRQAIWLNEPMYIQIGYLCHVATVAAQFRQALGDPNRFIEVALRSLPNKEASDDFLLAMLVGGGFVSTSNDLGAMINGSPFKPAGTTGHCYYQQYRTTEEALKTLLNSPLGTQSTVLLDTVSHTEGFKVLQRLIRKGLPAPFAERPDSGDTLQLGMHDLTMLEKEGHRISVVLEDGYQPADVSTAERVRKAHRLEDKRVVYGAGSAFIGPRSALETAYKACLFHDGSIDHPTDMVETMKICRDDPMKQSIPGLIDWFINEDTGRFLLGCAGETIPQGHCKTNLVLFDGLSQPGEPYVHPDYSPQNLAACKAIQDARSFRRTLINQLDLPATPNFSSNQNPIAMTAALARKRDRIVKDAR